MSFRFVIQPGVAIFFAIRAGLRDARNGQPPFLWNYFSSPKQRSELVQQSWNDVGTVLLVALLLDSIYQVMMHSAIYFLELLVVGIILALLPYVLLRGVVTRLARHSAESLTGQQPDNQAGSSETSHQQLEKKEARHGE